MSNSNYICYDGVDMDITYHTTQEEAIASLNESIKLGLDGNEWMNGVEDSFVAEITHKIDKRKLSDTGETMYEMKTRKITENRRKND